MTNKLNLTADFHTEKVKDMLSAIEKKYPGGIAWWRKNPVDFYQETIEDLFSVLETNNMKAIDAAYAYSESQLEMFGSFYKKAHDWISEEISQGREETLSPRFIAN